MQVAQRLLLFAALFLATASWFHAPSPVEAETEVGEKSTWVGMLDVDGNRLRLVLAIRSPSGGTRLPVGSGVN